MLNCVEYLTLAGKPCLSYALIANVVIKTFRPKLLMLASAHSSALFVQHVQRQRLKVIALIVAEGYCFALADLSINLQNILRPPIGFSSPMAVPKSFKLKLNSEWLSFGGSQLSLNITSFFFSVRQTISCSQMNYLKQFSMIVALISNSSYTYADCEKINSSAKNTNLLIDKSTIGDELDQAVAYRWLRKRAGLRR